MLTFAAKSIIRSAIPASRDAHLTKPSLKTLARTRNRKLFVPSYAPSRTSILRYCSSKTTPQVEEIGKSASAMNFVRIMTEYWHKFSSSCSDSPPPKKMQDDEEDGGTVQAHHTSMHVSNTSVPGGTPSVPSSTQNVDTASISSLNITAPPLVTPSHLVHNSQWTHIDLSDGSCFGAADCGGDGGGCE